MGLSLDTLREGDIIGIFPGCKVPLLVWQEGDHYARIGECFVWGLLDREGIIGKTEADLRIFRIY